MENQRQCETCSESLPPRPPGRGRRQRFCSSCAKKRQSAQRKACGLGREGKPCTGCGRPVERGYRCGDCYREYHRGYFRRTHDVELERKCADCDAVIRRPEHQPGGLPKRCPNCTAERRRGQGRAKYQRSRDQVIALVKKYQAEHPERHRANMDVANALERGDLVRPEKCEGCGGQLPKLHAHHDSYAPEARLKVRWLCARCHKLWHRDNVVI